MKQIPVILVVIATNHEFDQSHVFFFGETQSRHYNHTSQLISSNRKNKNDCPSFFNLFLDTSTQPPISHCFLIFLIRSYNKAQAKVLPTKLNIIRINRGFKYSYNN